METKIEDISVKEGKIYDCFQANQIYQTQVNWIKDNWVCINEIWTNGGISEKENVIRIDELKEFIKAKIDNDISLYNSKNKTAPVYELNVEDQYTKIDTNSNTFTFPEERGDTPFKKINFNSDNLSIDTVIGGYQTKEVTPSIDRDSSLVFTSELSIYNYSGSKYYDCSAESFEFRVSFKSHSIGDIGKNKKGKVTAWQHGRNGWAHSPISKTFPERKTKDELKELFMKQLPKIIENVKLFLDVEDLTGGTTKFMSKSKNLGLLVETGNGFHGDEHNLHITLIKMYGNRRYKTGRVAQTMPVGKSKKFSDIENKITKEFNNVVNEWYNKTIETERESWKKIVEENEKGK